MTGPTYTGTLVGSDGSKLIIRDGELVPADTPPTPPPAPVLIPDGANTVRAAGSSYPLAGVNPARVDYPGGRGPDELVAYVAPATVTATNAFGTEATVMAGQVIAAVDRQATKQSTGVIVPVGGVVLSGHGRARDWLNRYAVRGTPVTFTTEQQPVPIPTPTATGPGRPTVALFRKDGSGTTTRIPAGVTDFLYSFLQGTRLVEWGGETIETQSANLARWLDAGTGRRVCIAVGGAKGTVATGNRGAFLGGFQAAEKALGDRVSGIVWDIEGAAAVPDDIIAISKALASGRESTFVVGFTPPGGSPVQTYLRAAVPLHQAGLRVWFGQQLYEAQSFISEATAMSALAVPMAAGLPPDRVLVGTMVGSDTRHWTIDMCVQVLTTARKRWPDLGGCYLWSEGQLDQDDEWARRMAAVFA